MRKIAVVAVFAILAAMVPASVATAQPDPGSLSGAGTLMILNSTTANVVLFIKIEGTFQEIDLVHPDKQEFALPAADHSFRVCNAGSTYDATTDTCSTGAFGAKGTVHVEQNDILNFLITSQPLAAPTQVYIGENHTELIETDKSAMTLFNATGLAVDVCVGGNHVLSVPAGALNTDYAEFDGKDGEGQNLQVNVGPPAGPAFTTCAAIPGAPSDVGFPPGQNFVLSLANLLGGETTSQRYFIFPGNEPPATSQQVAAFCAVVLDAANITPRLQALFDEVEVGVEDTYPSPDEVEKVLNRIAALLEKGNETAPKDIREVWLRATAGFVKTGRLAMAQFDISLFPQDDLRDLVDGIEHPGEDDSEEAADTAALTAWVTTNCFGAIEAEPSFTG